MKKIHQKITTVLVGVLFLGVLFGGLSQLSMDGMNMSGMSACSLMSVDESLCSMSIAEHIGVWSSMFLSIVPLLLLGVAFAVICIEIAPNLLIKKWYVAQYSFSYLRERTYTYVVRSLQELFSQGILNPKLF